ncbi:septum site-determining protein MinC [Alteromonas confluentis]|uniref:Probable septum site-determining protein MinC n=1 Tax=Alteromonas confluentis TaxID=1656094 RepID=A0A1E7ZAL1_9ALTE|nr:septum site-determining protein MinC [Alteromonas confluentis]OFC70568.1 septum site-determining protein MinC [Alteromonas confluentis]
MSQPCFRMKGTTLTSIVLEVVSFEPDEFESQLAEKIASAPLFFTRSSLILHLNAPLSATEFELLVALCRRHDLQPMAIKGVTEGLKSTINDLGMADISQSKISEKPLAENKPVEASVSQSQQAPAEAPAQVETVTHTVEVVKPAKIVARPVRSGQQVYAEGSDLVILGAVSEGAEILADGNIHVYGTLRGRALAGVKGNEQARIFCQNMEAELVSIAGRFVMQENIQNKCWKKPAQAYLDADALLIEALS